MLRPVRLARELGELLLRQQHMPSPLLLTQPHLDAALDWLVEARSRSADGGIPAYYDVLRGSWRHSYPETTGYTIPTLLESAEHLRRPELRKLAIELADYLCAARTPEGGVAHWDDRWRRMGRPIVFDTGQVIFGWLAAWECTHEQAYLSAALDAADWLVRVQDSSGAWTNFQHLGVVKVIDTRVALALVRLGRVAGRPDFVSAARRNLDWAMGQQQPNGWFAMASFVPGRDPFTHTLAYTAEGLLECGLLLQEQSYSVSGMRLAQALVSRQRRDGALASTYGPDWQPTSRSSCLTGNCQMALLWLRCYEQLGDVQFRNAAHRALSFVASTQRLTSTDPAIRGGIAGSQPIFGPYERMKFPNWAAKFFIDALIAWRKLTSVEVLPPTSVVGAI